MKAKQNLVKTCLLVVLLLQSLTSGAQTVNQIAGRGWNKLILKSDGSLWAMDCRLIMHAVPPGQLAEPPVQIMASGVTAVAAGVSHSLILKNDGSLWVMDYHGMGHLVDGINQPEQIVNSGVTAIAAGYSHSLFLKSDGSLWAMGDNSGGQLGNGTCNSNNLPEQIVASNVMAIAAGWYHSLFIKSDGSLWGMGVNELGELGCITFDKTNRPSQIVASNVTAIAAGCRHSVFIKSDGSLWGMGMNNMGQLGNEKTIYSGQFIIRRPEQMVASNVTAIAAGADSTLLLKSDGSLWATGRDHDGQLGMGSVFHAPQPVQLVAANTTNTTLIVAGSYYSPFLKSAGSIWANSFNNNNYGSLSAGTKSTVNKSGQIVASPLGYNLISIELLSDGNVRLSYVGIAGANYALDRSFSLTTPNWLPQVTNSAGLGGVLVITNAPDTTADNFWRIRSVP